MKKARQEIGRATADRRLGTEVPATARFDVLLPRSPSYLGCIPSILLEFLAFSVDKVVTIHHNAQTIIDHCTPNHQDTVESLI